MKNMFVVILAILSFSAFAQNTPPFVPPVRNEASTNQTPATNVAVKVTKPKKADRNAPPPIFMVPLEVTVKEAPFDYTQVATNRYGDGPGEVHRYAVGEIQWTDPNAGGVYAPENYPAQGGGFSQPPLNIPVGQTSYQQNYYSTPYYGYEYGSAFQFSISPGYWYGYGPNYYNRPNRFNYGYRPHQGPPLHVGQAPRPNHNVPVPGARPHPGGFPTGGAQIGPGGSPPNNVGATPRPGAPPSNVGAIPRQGAPPSGGARPTPGPLPNQGAPPSNVGATPRQGAPPSGGAVPSPGSGSFRAGARTRN